MGILVCLFGSANLVSENAKLVSDNVELVPGNARLDNDGDRPGVSTNPACVPNQPTPEPQDLSGKWYVGRNEG